MSQPQGFASRKKASLLPLKRLALVIGNNYSAVPGIAPLQNAVNDATAMASKLELLGYTVSCHTEVDRQQFEEALDDFVVEIDKNTQAVFYFAGHGFQFAHDHRLSIVLVPILKRKLVSRMDIAARLITTEYLQQKLEERSPFCSIVLLDACRSPPPFSYLLLDPDLPMTTTFTSQTPTTTHNHANVSSSASPKDVGNGRPASAAVSRSIIRPSSPFTSSQNPASQNSTSSSPGTILFFSCEPGKEAHDSCPGQRGETGHGLFTTHLLDQLGIPGRSVRQIFAAVSGAVITESGGAQRPYLHEVPYAEEIHFYDVHAPPPFMRPGFSPIVDRAKGVFLGFIAGDKKGGPSRQMLELGASLVKHRQFLPMDVICRYIRRFEDEAVDLGRLTKRVYEILLSNKKEQIAEAEGKPVGTIGRLWTRGRKIEFTPEEVERAVVQADAENGSLGCNPVHRGVLLSMCAFISDNDLYDASFSESKLTHANPITADLTSAVNQLCRALIRGVEWRDAVRMVVEDPRHLPETKEAFLIGLVLTPAPPMDGDEDENELSDDENLLTPPPPPPPSNFQLSFRSSRSRSEDLGNDVFMISPETGTVTVKPSSEIKDMPMSIPGQPTAMEIFDHLDTSPKSLSVVRAAMYFLSIYDSFEEALEQSMAFAEDGNFAPKVVGAIGGARWGFSAISQDAFQHAFFQDVKVKAEEIADALSAEWARV